MISCEVRQVSRETWGKEASEQENVMLSSKLEAWVFDIGWVKGLRPKINKVIDWNIETYHLYNTFKSKKSFNSVHERLMDKEFKSSTNVAAQY